MAVIGIGDTIRFYRKNLGIKQKTLCDGLCPPSKLNRIEKGSLLPQWKLLYRLFGRLGIPSNFTYLITDSDFELYKVEEEIRAEISILTSLDRLKELIDEYNLKMDKDSNLYNQFYYYALSVYCFKSEEYDKAFKYSLSAIRCTVPNYSLEDEISKYCLSPFELLLINCVACRYSIIGDRKVSIAILDQILNYFDLHNFNAMDCEIYYGTILYNFANLIGLEENYVESLNVVNKMIEQCNVSKRKNLLPDALYVKGFCQYTLGSVKEGEKNIIHSIELLNLMHRENYIPLILADLSECFGEEFRKKIENSVETF